MYASHDRSSTKKLENLVTRLPAEYARAYGLAEAHSAIFVPAEDKGGMRGTVAMPLPESAGLLNPMMAHVDKERARVLLICDTQKQAQDFAAKVAALLPRHVDRLPKVTHYRHAPAPSLPALRCAARLQPSR